MEKKVLKVTGMSCEHCVKAVTEALNTFSLADVMVDLKGKTISFGYNSSSVSLAAIKAAIIDEGYEVIE